MLGLQSTNQNNLDLGLNTRIRPRGRELLPQLAEALKAFDRDERHSEFGDARVAEYFQAAKLLMTYSEFSEAQKLLRRVLSQAPHSSATMLALAECAKKLNQQDERLALLKVLVAQDDRASHHAQLAHGLYDVNHFTEALKHYLLALRVADDSQVDLFEVYKNVGNIFVRAHDFDSAEENYNKAYTINPNSSALMVNFGTLEIQRGDLEAARSRFREAILLDDQNDQGWVGLSIVHRSCGDFELSWANLQRALDLNPYNATAIQLGLGWVVKDEKWELVTNWLKNYLGRHSEDSVMSLALAQLHYLRRDLPLAEMEVTRTLSLDPESNEGLELLNLIRREKEERVHGWDHRANNGENR